VPDASEVECNRAKIASLVMPQRFLRAPAKSTLWYRCNIEWSVTAWPMISAEAETWVAESRSGLLDAALCRSQRCQRNLTIPSKSSEPINVLEKAAD
jgi:hypothetical protein